LCRFLGGRGGLRCCLVVGRVFGRVGVGGREGGGKVKRGVGVRGGGRVSGGVGRKVGGRTRFGIRENERGRNYARARESWSMEAVGGKMKWYG